MSLSSTKVMLFLDSLSHFIVFKIYRTCAADGFRSSVAIFRQPYGKTTIG